MPAMTTQTKLRALRPSCLHRRFSRVSRSAEAICTVAPEAKRQHRARYLHGIVVHQPASLKGQYQWPCAEKGHFTPNINVYQSSHPRIALLDSRVAAQEPYLLDEASGKYLVALRQE